MFFENTYIRANFIEFLLLVASFSFANRHFLEPWQISTFSIDQHCLPVFKVSTLNVCFGTNLTQRTIIIGNTAMDTMSIFDALKKIRFNTFGTCIFFTVFTDALFTNDGSIVICTYGACLGFFLLGAFGKHGVLIKIS